MLNKLKIIILVLSFNMGFSQGPATFFTKADAFFKANVSNGKVNYAGIHKNQDKLNELLSLANTVKVSKSDTKNYQAFWINAYNVSVIKGIIDNYPIKSPLDKAGFLIKRLISLAESQLPSMILSINY